MLAVVYLVFNEGYLAQRRAPQRRELAREGLELARQLAALMPAEPEAAGLAALLELHEARAATRFDADGPTRAAGGPGPGALGPRAHRRRPCAGCGGGGPRPPRPVPGAGRRSPPSTPSPASFARHRLGRRSAASTTCCTRLHADARSCCSTGPSRPGTCIGPDAALAEVDAARRPSSASTGCCTRPGPSCCRRSAASTRPARRPAGRWRWPPTRPSVSCSPVGSRTGPAAYRA